MVANTWKVSLNSNGPYTTIPTPSSWTWSYYDLSSDDSGRSLDGYMHKDLAGGVKRKHECTWQNVPASVARSIMTPAKAAIFIYIQFFDLYSGTVTTARVYTGDITATAKNAYNQTVFDVSLNFIEQ